MAYRISVTNLAVNAMDATVKWYGEQVPDLGRQWRLGMEAAIKSLAENPERCSLIPELEGSELEIRELLYGIGRRKTHRILFRIVEQTVEVLAVRHVAQDDYFEENG
ncbi:MAG: hypothetical protein Tsb009_34680 [Planctomycetaceae bacterium]